MFEKSFLGLQLQTQAQLVASSVDVLAIYQRRQGELDTCSQRAKPLGYEYRTERPIH